MTENKETMKPSSMLTPLEKFRRDLPDALDAELVSQDAQVLLFESHEELLYALIISRIHDATERGEFSCRIDLSQCNFDGLTADTVLEELKPDLEKAGYRVHCHDLYGFVLFWGDEKKERYAFGEPF